MKVTCKTVAGVSQEIEVEGTDTVASVKGKIEAAMSTLGGPVGKLIHLGKVLEDSKTMTDYNVTDGQSFVVMVNKAKPAPATPANPPAAAAAAPAAPAAAAAPAPATPQTGDAPSTPAVAEASPAAPAASASTPSYETSASALLTGDGLEATVAQIMDMGFPREQVIKAMRSAFNNPDRAVEYLMTGIPEGADAPAAPAAAPQGGQGAAPQMDAAMLAALQAQAGEQGGGNGGPLDFLRNDPQFNMLRQVVQARPEMLEPLLQQIGTQHPEVLEAIQTNQEDFVRMMNEPVDPAQAQAALEAMMAQGGGGGGGEDGGPGSVQIELTPQEGEALERLVALGFNKNIALEAYLLCDKNEELAANYLFDNGGDMMADGE